jgi:rfaE bifunctional protein kinase chain/domain
MNDEILKQLLADIKKAKIAVFGDFCLDAYWLIDENANELSVETSQPIRQVAKQKYSLGGAGNVVANLIALGVGEVYAIGMLGNDLFGDLMRQKLEDLKVDVSSMLTCQNDWQTMVYCKPYIGEFEEERIDFGSFNTIENASIEDLTKELNHIAGIVDMVILNQQVLPGVSSEKMIECINTVIADNSKCSFIVDSRHHPELYRGAMLKINAHEAAQIVDSPRSLDERVTAGEAYRYAKAIYDKISQPVFLTRGENGIVVYDKDELKTIPGIQLMQRTDPVGAGDTTISALASVLSVGGDTFSAATIANIAATVTVREIQTTGTASPEEILKIGPKPDYIYLPELADDPRRANFVKGSEIEQIRKLPEDLSVRHAIFDHDGTISTLREGWEQIMEPMMVRAILGEKYENADEVLYHKVIDTIKRFIDRTTGIQTLVQMQGLIELVIQFKCVPDNEILDIYGYKEIYNQALLEMVKQRVLKLKNGELNSEDFQIKNAQLFLEKLHKKGVKLYLASGTDEFDVIKEAEAMGYAHLFEGRIFGATGDINVEAKREVLERIILENNLTGSGFATFGDGPVEMRECRKRNGVAVGIASDEIRRFGLNSAKRSRLIRAGADLLIPDFSQMEQLLNQLKF